MAVVLTSLDESQQAFSFPQQEPSGQHPTTVLAFALLLSFMHDLPPLSLQQDMGWPASFAS